jgi:hypothetical protein
MSKITIIIPVCEVNDELKELYKKAVGSVPITDEGRSEYPVLVVGPKDIINAYKDKAIEKIVDIEYLENKNSGFQDQINFAAKNCKTEYFSVLEVDDTFNTNWFQNVEKHIETMPETPFFLPLTELFDVSEKQPIPIGFANEIALTTSFSDKIGYIGIDELEEFSDFSCTGGVYRTSDFLSIGGLKNTLKVVFWYEFLLRAANNHKEAYVIPKLGYKHNLRREGSLMDTVSKTIDEDEAKFWIKTAKQEYFFTEARVKEYKK